MPKDKAGKYHPNSQKAMTSDKMAQGKATPQPAADAPTEKPANDSEMQPGHAAVAMAHEQDGGKHMHVTEHPAGGYTSHHVGHDGEVQGPHDHENMEALKQHMGQFFDEESQEQGEPVMVHHGAAHGGHGDKLSGM